MVGIPASFAGGPISILDHDLGYLDSTSAVFIGPSSLGPFTVDTRVLFQKNPRGILTEHCVTETSFLRIPWPSSAIKLPTVFHTNISFSCYRCYILAHTVAAVLTNRTDSL